MVKCSCVKADGTQCTRQASTKLANKECCYQHQDYKPVKDAVSIAPIVSIAVSAKSNVNTPTIHVQVPVKVKAQKATKTKKREDPIDDRDPDEDLIEDDNNEDEATEDPNESSGDAIYEHIVKSEGIVDLDQFIGGLPKKLFGKAQDLYYGEFSKLFINKLCERISEPERELLQTHTNQFYTS
jgi:hypothetical protein